MAEKHVYVVESMIGTWTVHTDPDAGDVEYVLGSEHYRVLSERDRFRAALREIVEISGYTIAYVSAREEAEKLLTELEDTDGEEKQVD